MAKLLTAMLLFTLLSCFFTATATAGQAETAPNRPITWKMATVAPRSMGWNKHVEKILIPAMTKATKGEFNLKIYWGGVMGSDTEVLRKMREDILQGAGFDARGTVLACKEMAVLELPFMFESWEEVDFIRKTMFDDFAGFAEKNGLFLIMWLDQDFDQVYSSKWDFTDLSQFPKATFANWSGSPERRVFKALGARSVLASVPNMVHVLKKGEADSAVGPAMWVLGANMYSVMRTINTMKIRYSPAGIFITKKAWKDLPEKYHSPLFENYAQRGDQVRRFVEATRGENDLCIEAMEKYGLKVVETRPRQLAQMRTATRVVWGELTGVLYPKSLLDKLLAQLKAFREKQAQAQ